MKCGIALGIVLALAVPVAADASPILTMPAAVQRANRFVADDLLATAIASALNDSPIAGWEVSSVHARDCMRLSPVRVICKYWLRAYSDAALRHRMWQRNSIVEVIRRPSGYLAAHEYQQVRIRYSFPASGHFVKPTPPLEPPHGDWVNRMPLGIAD